MIKHAPSAALILVMLLAGCSAEQERAGPPEATYVPAAPPEGPMRQTGLSAQPVSTGSLPASDARAVMARALRNERLIYAQGLEKILVANGVGASVIVDEDGQAGPTPALMFFGQFSRSFIQRALTDGAVLERARALGFRAVNFFDRGPEGNYVFELAKAGPLPKCAARSRMCL
ncbi:MAG TPA: hypothetical protein VH913_05270 [Hyphomicrobiaceae bacterium]|jgi:hypothetical protein